ncbi:dynamin family protein [Hypoxylon sp. FL0890]|nr:dynamin family protein [Hypoxylon sp. FL0890]
MADSEEEKQVGVFGNPTLLNKIDELRRLNVSAMVPLPQLVVVGDQSVGKSSVLESLTGFPFPRAVSLCTRYATEIICRRGELGSVVATIRPAVGSSAERAAKLQNFKLVLNRNNKGFEDVFHQASVTMGVRLSSDPASASAPAFSEDVLRIEITGPKEEHLTIIDVPGIIEVPTPGLTKESDIPLVKSMVERYIREPRTIILAVVPCTHDVATQQILKRAAEVDPDGKRTLGVLTKPDLLKETATKDAVVDLVKGNRNELQLGYFVIRNRGADDVTSDQAQRNSVERAFFREAPWDQLDESRLGIDSLRLRLRELLMERTKHDFPLVKREVTARLKEKNERLKGMGQSRMSTDQQRMYLGRVAAQFSDIGRYALDAYYTGHPIFAKNRDLRLITRIHEISEAFAELLFARGHFRKFQGEKTSPSGGDTRMEDEADESAVRRNELYRIPFEIPDENLFPELDGLLAEPFFCSSPIEGDIKAYIQEIYWDARGQELGTFGSSMLPTTFKEQAQKWKALTLAHVSNAILVVHHFVHNTLAVACPDVRVRTQLWAFLMDDLLGCYRRAIKQAEFLLQVECEGKTITCNPDFTDLLVKNRRKHERLRAAEATKKSFSSNHEAVVRVADVQAAINQVPDVVEQICEDVHDVLKAYYEISRSRFVDAVYQQVVDHFLLNDEHSALHVLTPERVMSMSSEQLKGIAEEDPGSRREREKLKREIASLEKAIAVLRL